MMLHLISRDHGRELSVAISEMFVYERIRNEQDLGFPDSLPPSFLLTLNNRYEHALR